MKDLDQSPNDPNYVVKTTARLGETDLFYQETPDLADVKVGTTQFSVENSVDRNPTG